MENPQLIYTSLQKSTKALERPVIEKPKHTLYSFKLSQNLKARRSIDKTQEIGLPQTHRNISSFLQEQSSNDGSSKNLNKHKKRMSFFQKTLESIYPYSDENQLAQNSPKWNQEKSQFNLTLTKFSELMANSARQNHSPRKDTIPGAEEAFDSTKLMSITMRNFKTLEPCLKPRQKHEVVKAQVNQSLNLPEIYRVNVQTKREKDTFYKMHPYFLKKENPKSLERRVDKRRNLIALEELSIRLKSKETSKIYDKK